MKKKQRLKGRVVFLLVLGTAAFALFWLFSALNSPDIQAQQLALKLLSLGALGAGLVMAFTMLTRVETPEMRSKVSRSSGVKAAKHG